MSTLKIEHISHLDNGTPDLSIDSSGHLNIVNGNLQMGGVTMLNTSTGAPLPLSGGAITGELIIADTGALDIRMGTDKRVTWSGTLGEIGSVAGFQATNTAGSALSSFGMRGTDLRFATGSAERLRITDSAVGIGTDSPSTTASGYNGGTLHVHNTGTGSSIRLTNNTTGTSTTSGMLISKWSDSKTYFTNFDDGADTIFTQSNSSGSLVTTLTLDGDGNVGICTDDPSASLQVGNAADQHEWITVNSLGGYYSGIKLARGAGDWSSPGNNNYGMLVTDGGFEISKFTNKGNNTTGRDAYLRLDDTEVNVEKPFGLLSATSDPTGTRAGQLYYNSNGQKIKFYDGTKWQDVSSTSIIKSNLLLHWDMTNGSSYSGSGSTVNDISGNGYNGTIQGNPTYSSSNNGYMIFDGYGDYITSSFTQPAGARAFGMWIYYTSTSQPAGEGYQLQGIQAANGYTYQGIQDGGNLYFYIGTGTGGTISHQLSSGQWYYQVITFDGSSYAIYVNGSLIQSGSASPGTTGSTFQASAINGNYRLYGYGSEWQFYGQNLTAAEVQQNFNAGRGRYGI